MGDQHVTLEEVARRTGVSLATASRVLNGSSRQVSDKLRRRVMDGARELGYLPNASAQTLARNTSSLVGLIVHDITDPYFSSIAAGVTRRAEADGLVVMLGTTGRDPDRELNLLSTLRSHRARAVVLAGSRSTATDQMSRLSQEITTFLTRGGRMTCISQEGLPADTVVPDNRGGARALARELVALGHRSFAVLAGPKDLWTALERLEGFGDGLAEAGLALPDKEVVHGSFTRDGGYEAMRRLLDRGSQATCVFAVNDVMATGAMAALRDAERQIPRDLSIAGFDDIPTLRDLTPGLSTVRLPLEWIGEEATRLALEEAPVEPPRRVSIAGEVVLRESTASPAA